MNKEILAIVKELTALDKKTLSQKALKTVEEVGELAKKVLPYDNAHGTRRMFVDKDAIIEEVVDGILCLLSVAYSLDFKDEEIEEWMVLKAKKWHNLQKGEENNKEAFPFEIHITVRSDKWSEDRFLAFKQACVQLGVKDTILELQDQDGKGYGLDVMTSQRLNGTNESVLQEVDRVRRGLEQRGFIVVRKKIETVPWHPAAPNGENQRMMPKDCYFESHIEIDPESLTVANLRTLSKIVSWFHAQFSVNVRREGQAMITLRHGSGYLQYHKDQVESLVADINSLGIKIIEQNHEFSIYDTNILHDAEWINQRTTKAGFEWT